MANERISVEITADGSRVGPEVGKVKKQLAGIADASDAIGAAWGKVGGIIAGALSIGAIGGFLAKVNEIGDSLNDLSQRLGASASNLQVLQLAAAQAGGSADAMNTALAKMSDTLGGAISGNKAAAAAFDKLGLSAQQLANTKTDEAFRQIADRISQIPNAYERASIAQDVFGKGAKDLAGLFNAGGSAIDEVNQKLAAQGALLDDLDVAKIGIMNDELALQRTIVENLGIKFTAGFAPAVGVATSAVADMLAHLGGATEAGKLFGTVMVAAIKIVETAAYGLAAVFETVRAVISGMLAIIADGVASLIGGVATVAERLGFDWAAKVRTAATTLDNVAGALQNVSDTARENAISAGAYAIQAATEIVKAGEIFNAAQAEYERKAAESAARNAAPQGAGGALAGTAGGAQDQIGLTDRQLAGAFQGISNAAGQVTDPTTDYRVIQEQMVNELLVNERTAYYLKLNELQSQSNDSLLDLALQSSQQLVSAQEIMTNSVSQNVGVMLGSIAQATGVAGKNNKALAIAQTIWSTGSAIMNAMAQLPWPANLAAAAAAAATGAAQLANIKKTNVGSGGSVIGAKGGTAGGVTPALSDNVTGTKPEDTEKSVTQVVIQGNVFSSQETANWIIDQIRDAVSTRDTVFIASNSRQAMELAGAT